MFVTLWATGPDPRLDALFRVAALRAGPRGWHRFDRFVDPFPEREDEGVSARMVREFGVHRRQLAGAAEASEVWPAFREFCGDGTLFVPDAERAAPWLEHLDGYLPGPRAAPTCIGLTELAALLAPGRLALLGDGLVDALCPTPRGAPKAAVTPEELRAATAELTRRFLGDDPRVVRVAALGYARAQFGLEASDPPAAERLAALLALVDAPGAWTEASGQLFLGADLAEGVLTAAMAIDPDGPLLSDDMVPLATQAFETWAEAPKLPPGRGAALPFPPEDERRLDALFEVHLPALISGELGIRREDALRPSQHALAREVARALGGSELCLMHAPTGTGKTMAYLLPALLWARRHGVRIGVATYTRALQEQAMDREVPRALSALARAESVSGTRVSLLKGRENYLCYRSLRLLAPASDDEPEAWLAWTRLAVFASTDIDGDLDRFPRRPPVRLSSEDRHRAIVTELVASARARSGCCTRADDRSTCAAELARERAERSHLVLTNQAFALTRPEFLRNVVFDECEHLHDVAAGAWSHRASLREARAFLERLRQVRRARGNGALDVLERQLLPGTPSHDSFRTALFAWERAALAVEHLDREARRFESWRDAQRERVEERDEHTLFARFVDGADGAPLVRARDELAAAIAGLETELTELSAIVADLPLRRRSSTARALDLARASCAELGEALLAWVPVADGKPRLSRSTFSDVERDARGEIELVARVLLPHEVLARDYYPDLEAGVFLSAATLLRGSFDASAAYLGLDRVGTYEELEDGVTRPVRTAAVPEAFDYGRVLIGVPRDVPSPGDRIAHLDYIARFLLWLGERTRGRLLALFTSLDDVRRVGEALRTPFRERRIPLWYQGMTDAPKEELAERFRERVDSILLGVDTFWYGADFPGETLEYLVLARLPYGVPDRFHHAQCATIGTAQQRMRIYMPRALAKFRQGFGRLMRRASDRGCVFVLDRRITEARHREFLSELPHEGRSHGGGRGARLVRGDTTRVLREALAHMGMLEDVRRRGLAVDFAPPAAEGAHPAEVPPPRLEAPPHVEAPPDSLPF